MGCGGGSVKVSGNEDKGKILGWAGTLFLVERTRG
jgi:hypothetical protein